MMDLNTRSECVMNDIGHWLGLSKAPRASAHGGEVSPNSYAKQYYNLDQNPDLDSQGRGKQAGNISPIWETSLHMFSVLYLRGDQSGGRNFSNLRSKLANFLRFCISEGLISRNNR